MLGPRWISQQDGFDDVHGVANRIAREADNEMGVTMCAFPLDLIQTVITAAVHIPDRAVMLSCGVMECASLACL